MTTRLLDPAEFKATFSEPMREVSQTANNVIDIWPYVDAIPNPDLFGHALADGLVEHVYRDGSETYDHVLDLNEEYGLLAPQ